MKIKFMFAWTICAVLFLTSAACVKPGELRTETKTVEAGGVESVEVDINMGAGELRLSGGATALMEGSFTTNIERWKPEIDYKVNGRTGRLRVRQKRSRGIHFGRTHNDWTILLNNSLLSDLHINLGAGESRLDLRDMSLESLDVNMGVGEMNLDLRGRRPKSFRIGINGGVGSANIRLPRDIGVRASIHGGIGSVTAHGLEKSGRVYTNSAYGQTPVSIDLDINAGVGSVVLKIE